MKAIEKMYFERRWNSPSPVVFDKNNIWIFLLFTSKYLEWRKTQFFCNLIQPLDFMSLVFVTKIFLFLFSLNRLEIVSILNWNN